MNRILFLLTIIFISYLIVHIGQAHESNSSQYSTDAVIGSGAEKTTSNTYESTQTEGQVAIGDIQSDSYSGCVGFWCDPDVVSAKPVVLWAYSSDLTDVESYVNFQVNYSDADNDKASPFICKGSNCISCNSTDSSNCYCRNLSKSYPLLTCNYLAQQTDDRNNSYWVYVADRFDNSDIVKGNDTFLINRYPEHDNPLLVSTGENKTKDNLTCYNQSTDDPDNDTVINVYNWYKNNASLTVLNTEFEVNNSGKDHSGYDNNFTVYNAEWVNARDGHGYRFGIGDYITINDSNSLDVKDISIETWFNGTGGSLLRKKGSYGLNYTNNKIEFSITTSSTSTLQSSNIIAENWTYVVATYDGTEMKLYINGTLNASMGKTGNINTTDSDLYIGYDGTSFSGIIGRTKIYNHSLSAKQIDKLYGEWYNNLSYSTIVYRETTKGDTWSCSVTPSDTRLYGITKYSNNLSVRWSRPTVIFVDPTPDSGRIGDDYLYVNVSVEDYNAEGAVDKCWVTWDNGTSVKNYSMTKVGTGAIVSCYKNFSTTDGVTYSYKAWTNNTFSEVGNTSWRTNTINYPPSIPQLLSPENDTHITNQTPTFVWLNSTDNDDDIVTYHLMVDGNQEFNSPEENGVNVTNIAEGAGENTSYTTQDELNITYHPYYWKVKAYDGYDYTNWSEIWEFYIDSFVIVLVNNTIDFGTMYPEDTNDTTDDNPEPFKVVNQGNVFLNITVTSTKDIWKIVDPPSEHFQFKADNRTNPDAFNYLNSRTVWTNMTVNQSIDTIASLDYNDTRDIADVDIKMVIPEHEPPANKSVTIIFESRKS